MKIFNVVTQQSVFSCQTWRLKLWRLYTMICSTCGACMTAISATLFLSWSSSAVQLLDCYLPWGSLNLQAAHGKTIAGIIDQLSNAHLRDLIMFGLMCIYSDLVSRSCLRVLIPQVLPISHEEKKWGWGLGQEDPQGWIKHLPVFEIVTIVQFSVHNRMP